MIRPEIIQGIVLGKQKVILFSSAIDRPATIKRILLPAQPEGKGWIQCRFGICDVITDWNDHRINIKDITTDIFKADHLCLPQYTLDYEPLQVVKRINWKLAILVENKMAGAKEVTFEVEFED